MGIHTLPEEITIQEILAEAEKHGLRSEVIKAAEQIWAERKNEEEFRLPDAYHLAYYERIK